MTAIPTFEGFSLSHAAVLDASSSSVVGAGTGAESQTLYGVRNGTLATDSGNFENTGDDFVLSEWFWFNFANLTIESGFMTFNTLSQVTGTAVSSFNSAGVGDGNYYALPLWTWNSLNQITRPVALRVPARDTQGAIRTTDFILYRVQFQPFNFTGPSYKNGLTVSLAGRALMSLYDEQGNALPSTYPRSLGRIINKPGSETGAFLTQPFAGV
jgi:hypothetical protein